MDKKTIFEKIKALVMDAEEPAQEEPFDAKKEIEDLIKRVSDLEDRTAIMPSDNKINQVLELLQKLIDMEAGEPTETAEPVGDDDDGTEDKGTPKATDSVTITVPKVTDGVKTPVTPAMLNAMAAQFYKKG
jgi:hypothetical protein